MLQLQYIKECTEEIIERLKIKNVKERITKIIRLHTNRDALHHLGTITGQVTTDEVLGTIFSRFCIGK
jgi:tRNA modification GTPase